MYATLTPGFTLKYFVHLAQILPTSPAVPPASDAKAESARALAEASSFEAAKKRCRLFGSKETAIRFCIDQARWNLKRTRTEPPPRPKTELEKEIARCDTIGKTAVQMACKREAPKRVADRRRAAAEAPPDRRTPLEKAIASCRYTHSKMPQTMECIRAAKRRYAPAK